jgi:hypothetical protein
MNNVYSFKPLNEIDRHANKLKQEHGSLEGEESRRERSHSRIS